MKNNFQYIVVGAGIVGLAISEILSRKSNGNILVIDNFDLRPGAIIEKFNQNIPLFESIE